MRIIKFLALTPIKIVFTGSFRGHDILTSACPRGKPFALYNFWDEEFGTDNLGRRVKFTHLWQNCNCNLKLLDHICWTFQTVNSIKVGTLSLHLWVGNYIFQDKVKEKSARLISFLELATAITPWCSWRHFILERLRNLSINSKWQNKDLSPILSESTPWFLNHSTKLKYEYILLLSSNLLLLLKVKSLRMAFTKKFPLFLRSDQSKSHHHLLADDSCTDFWRYGKPLIWTFNSPSL